MTSNPLGRFGWKQKKLHDKDKEQYHKQLGDIKCDFCKREKK